MQAAQMGGTMVMILDPDTTYAPAILGGFDGDDLPKVIEAIMGHPETHEFIHGHGLGLYVSPSHLAGLPNYLGSILADEAQDVETNQVYGRVVLTAVDEKGTPCGLTLAMAADLEDVILHGREGLKVVLGDMMAKVRKPADDAEAANIQRYTQRDAD